MKLSIDQMQEAATRMFRTVVGILEEDDFPYVGFFGTMLGAVRHQGPIPWDSDIDMLIPESEMDRFLELMKRRLPPEYRVDFGDPKAPHLPFPRIGLSGYETQYLHIDVYRMVGYPKRQWKQKLFGKYGKLLISLRCAKVYSYTGKKLLLARLVRALTVFHSPESYARRFNRLCKRYPYESSEQVGLAADRNVVRRGFTRELFESVQVPYADFSIRIPKDYEKVLQILFGDYRKFPPEETRRAAMETVFDVVPLQQEEK